MPALETYDYAVIRVVPRVEREEFINVGVILSCQARQFLAACTALDEHRLKCLAPQLDCELLKAHLESFSRVCTGGVDSGPIGQLPPRARFHWLTARRSSMLQTSPVHSGRCAEPAAMLEHLVQRMVRPLP